MNRQLTGLLAWGALALIVAVPSAEVFLSRSADVPESSSEPRSEGAALSQTPAIGGPLEAVAPDQPDAEIADMEVVVSELSDRAPDAIPHDTALADALVEPEAPKLTPDVVTSVKPAPSPIRTIGGTGLAVAAKNVTGTVPPDSDSLDVNDAAPDTEVAAIEEIEPLQQVAPQTIAPMTTEMTLLPDVVDANNEPATDPIETAIAVPAPEIDPADTTPEMITLPELEAAPQSAIETDVIVSADITDENVSYTEFGTTQIVPVPMPAYMRPTPPTKSTARYVAVTQPTGEMRPAAAPVYSTQPETYYRSQPRSVSRTDYDGTSRFTADQVRSRKQRERIARQMFADNPNRRFVTFNLPNGQRETIYRYGGWDEGQHTGRQRLDTFQDGEFYRSEAASRNQFTVLEGGWSRFTSSDGSFVEQLPSQRGNGVRLDLVN